ncbi:MAG TPA: hypothetical protein VMZ53_12105 [Kofleriaceae bacterium]|nr:hypothetical protein [Kofleriaceae bacterium]
MRISAAVLCLVAGCSGCKDRDAVPKQAPSPRTTAVADENRPAPPRPSLEPAEVSGLGVVPATQLGPKIVMSKDGISLDGQQVVAISEDGVIDRARLEALTQQLEQKATSDAPVALTLDATLPYRRIAILLDALKKGGFRNIALLTGSGSTMIPIELKDTNEANTEGVRPIVTVKQNYVSVWSASGTEGTRKQPKLAYELTDPPDFKPVTRALADIVQSHWPDGKRSDAERIIILQLDGDKPAQLLLQLAAAVRADGSLVLFPGIYLSAGA